MLIRKRTLAIILLFGLLLCLQIEAAEAGLLADLKQHVKGLISPFSLLMVGCTLFSAVLVYFAIFDKSLNLRENPGKDR